MAVLGSLSFFFFFLFGIKTTTERKKPQPKPQEIDEEVVVNNKESTQYQMETIESENRFDSPPQSPKQTSQPTKFKTPTPSPVVAEDQEPPSNVVATPPTKQRSGPSFSNFSQRLQEGVTNLPVASTVWAAAKPELIAALDLYLNSPTDSKALIVSFCCLKKKKRLLHSLMFTKIVVQQQDVAEYLLIQREYQKGANLLVERFLYGILQVNPRKVKPSDIEGLSIRLTEMAKHAHCLKSADSAQVFFRRSLNHTRTYTHVHTPSLSSPFGHNLGREKPEGPSGFVRHFEGGVFRLLV